MADNDNNDLTGSQKAAVFLMAMGEARSSRLIRDLDKDEIEELLDAKKSLGPVSPNIIENIVNEYDVKRSALPMNQPQNSDLKAQQDQARLQAAQKPAPRKRKKPAPERPRAEVEAEGNGLSPTTQHLTNIEV